MTSLPLYINYCPRWYACIAYTIHLHLVSLVNLTSVVSLVNLASHLLLCSRGVSTRHTPLPIMSVHTYLHGGAMRTKRHYTQLAQAIAQSLCGYSKAGPLWKAVQHTQHRNWADVVLLVADTDVIDWCHIILVDYRDRVGWGPALSALVLRELNLIANSNTP